MVRARLLPWEKLAAAEITGQQKTSKGPWGEEAPAFFHLLQTFCRGGRRVVVSVLVKRRRTKDTRLNRTPGNKARNCQQTRKLTPDSTFRSKLATLPIGRR